MTKSRVTILCTCGGDKFDMPANPKPTDSIRCTSCGETGIYGEVMGQAISALEKHLTEALHRRAAKPGEPSAG